MTGHVSPEQTKGTYISYTSGIVSVYDIDEIIMENYICYVYFKISTDKMERYKKNVFRVEKDQS